MTENPDRDDEHLEENRQDMFAWIKGLRRKRKEEGKAIPDSPNIDAIIEMDKKDAGSPPSAINEEKIK